MAEPFDRRSPAADSMMGRLLGKRLRTSAIREIEDRLARAERVCEVSKGEVTEIAERYSTDLSQRLRTPRRNLYRRFMQHCLVDQALSAEEGDDLVHLRNLLCLSGLDAAGVHDEVAREVYGDAVSHVLQDQKLDPEEAEFLKRIRDELKLPEEVADSLLEEGTQRARERFMARAIAREDVLLVSRDAVLQLEGSSSESIEDAARNALEEATRAVPNLRFVELKDIRAELADGQIALWHVTVKGVVERK